MRNKEAFKVTCGLSRYKYSQRAYRKACHVMQKDKGSIKKTIRDLASRSDRETRDYYSAMKETSFYQWTKGGQA